MRMEGRYSRVLGSLVGFAIGDAMGATTEFMNRKEIAKEFTHINDILGGGWLGLRAGEVTDDTQMMMAVARARMKGPEAFLTACCENFSDWYRGNPRDVGNTCRTAIIEGMGKSPDVWMWLSMYRQNQSYTEDLGNGSVMRALFLALTDEPHLAIHQGRLTHNNSICDKEILRYCQAIHQAMYMTNKERGWAKENLIPPTRLMPPTGHVTNSVNNALYWVYNTHSFEKAVTSPVNDGGDADTIAALAGGLAGAYYGFEAIPQRWIDKLDQEVLGELKQMAQWVIEH